MQEDALRDLVDTIHRQRTERQNVELKAAHEGFPKRIYDTLSSFSNQDEGGILIFGVNDKPNYEIVGVYDAEDVQRKISEACKQMEPLVRALTTICEINGKMVVSAEIPSVEYSLRPVFYKGQERLKGSFVHVGDADELMTEYEVYSYEAFRNRVHEDARPVERAKLELFDQKRLARYLEAVRAERPNLSTMTDSDIFEIMGVTRDRIPTLAGVMTFSKYPQAYFPQLCVTAVLVPGTQLGDEGPDGERFQDNARITGALPEMLEEAERFVRRNSRTRTIIDAGGKRADQAEYPARAVREALLNMLIHRDYSVYTENTPACIEMYRDRIVFRNTGGLVGTTSLHLLGRSRLETRNTVLNNMLELLHIAENRYSGVPTMLRELKNAGMRPPEFAVRHGEFSTTFFNNIFDLKEPALRAKYTAGAHTGKPARTKPTVKKRVTRKDWQQAILDFCRAPKSRNELTAFTGKSRYYTMVKLVQPLLVSGKLKRTLPEKPRSIHQRFVAV
ncbi:MAG: putative DNA binding domain-containing protein [Fretibacterium sp.]|nr:putative DNA binding domain-containing protein [Fretibacterium sp.]